VAFFCPVLGIHYIGGIEIQVIFNINVGTLVLLLVLLGLPQATFAPTLVLFGARWLSFYVFLFTIGLLIAAVNIVDWC
jgi:hypothetical protein